MKKGLLALVFVTSLGCATHNKPKCTYLCRNSEVPTSCYCLEDEIKKAAEDFHP